MTSDCTRCGKVVDINSPDHNEGEATPEGAYICSTCVTPQERQAIDEADMALSKEMRRRPV